VDRNDSNLSFFIDDFSDYNLFRVQSDLYAKSEFEFATDLKNVNISFPKDSEGGISSLVLNWDGQISKLTRAPKDYTTALELLSQNRIDEAVCQIEINKEQYQSLSFVEDVLNLAGYQYLNQEKFDDAIKVFSLNVNLFPGSWNAYDSLGEAYMKAGKKELAIENYKKSLELNPKNETAQRIIES
jgi:tetratricopeptide (TPR) repeat protein